MIMLITLKHGEPNLKASTSPAARHNLASLITH